MARVRDSTEPDEPGPDEPEGKHPEGLPMASSSARLRIDRAEQEGAQEPRRDPTPLRALRPPASDGGKGKKRKKKKKRQKGNSVALGSERPAGLTRMTTSARNRLELALDALDESIPPGPPDEEEEADEGKARPGLSNMTYSARLRLELALDETIPPPKLPVRTSVYEVGYIPFDEGGAKIIRSLSRWIAFCGLITLAVGALTGLSYLTGPGSVAHVVVGILACALSVWQLLASWNFHRVLRDRQRQHHLIHGFGLLRSALLLKAILLFSGMVLGCFAFSIAASLLFLL